MPGEQPVLAAMEGMTCADLASAAPAAVGSLRGALWHLAGAQMGWLGICSRSHTWSRVACGATLSRSRASARSSLHRTVSGASSSTRRARRTCSARRNCRSTGRSGSSSGLMSGLGGRAWAPSAAADVAVRPARGQPQHTASSRDRGCTCTRSAARRMIWTTVRSRRKGVFGDEKF